MHKSDRIRLAPDRPSVKDGSVVPAGLRFSLARKPSDKSLGYCQASLWDSKAVNSCRHAACAHGRGAPLRCRALAPSEPLLRARSFPGVLRSYRGLLSSIVYIYKFL